LLIPRESLGKIGRVVKGEWGLRRRSAGIEGITNEVAGLFLKNHNWSRMIDFLFSGDPVR
jgi:hypothetical protein